MWEAFGRRLRRNYFWIFLILYASWVAKIWLFPEPAGSIEEFVSRSAVGPLSGEIMIALGFVLYMSLTCIAIATVTMTRATGEVLPRFGEEAVTAVSSAHGKSGKGGWRAFLAPRHKRREFLAMVITGKPREVSDRILSDLRRGVTALSGRGMYSGADRTVLLCALTVTEVHNLKTAVAKEDPQAFVIVSPAQEILGRGFVPLEDEDEKEGNE
jgi:hypothetical protein